MTDLTDRLCSPACSAAAADHLAGFATWLDTARTSTRTAQEAATHGSRLRRTLAARLAALDDVAQALAGYSVAEHRP